MKKGNAMRLWNLRSILLFLIFLSTMKVSGQDFDFLLSGQPFHYNLVTDKVFIKMDRGYTHDEMRSMLTSDKLAFDLDDHSISQMKFIRLSHPLEETELRTLIRELNENAHVQLASPFLDHEGDRVALTDLVIVKLGNEGTEEALNAACEENGMINEGIIQKIIGGFYGLRIPKSKVFDQIDYVKSLAALPAIASAEPNLIRSLQLSFNDPYINRQYAINASHINAVGAWTLMGPTLAGGNPNIKVAVIDVGVQLNHPDLVGKLVSGYDATFGSGSPAGQSTINTSGGQKGSDVYNGHGTSMAGLIVAPSDYTGIIGIAHKSKVVPIRIAEIITTSTGPVAITDDVILAAGISYASNTADILCIAWGTQTSAVISNAITNAVLNGRLGKGSPVFCASGNDGSTILPFPANMSDVIAVGSTNASDQRSSFSNYATNLDIAAPGEGIFTTDLSGADGAEPGDYDTLDGTSFSSPYAAGLMALILSISPTFTQAVARDIIESTCDKTGGYSYSTNGYYPAGTWSNELGYGRINANTAITKALAMIQAPLSVPGPLIITANAPATNCYEGPAGSLSSHPYFNILLANGTPYTDVFATSQYNYFLVDFFSDAACTIISPYNQTAYTYFVSSTNPTAPNSLVKKIYLDCSTITSFPAVLGIYIRVKGGTPGNIVTTTSFVQVTVLRAPEFTIPTANFCPGFNVHAGTLLQTTVAGNSKVWNMGSYTNINMANTNDPIIYNIPASGTIQMTWTAANGCATTRSGNLNVRRLVANPAPTTQALVKCITGGSFQIGPASITGGSGNYSYNWMAHPGMSATNVQNPTINPATAGAGTVTHILSVYDNTYGCSTGFNYIVSIGGGTGTITISSNDNNICPGKPVTLQASTSVPVLTGSFYLGTAPISTISGMVSTGSLPYFNAFVAPMTTTTYTFKATDTYGCPFQANYTVTVNPPSLFVNAGPDISTCYRPITTITGSASGGTPSYTYKWGASTFSQVFTVPYADASYTLTVTDAEGCVATDVVQVTRLPTIWYGSVAYMSQNAGTSFNTTGLLSGASSVNPNSTSQTVSTAPYTYQWSPAQYLTNPTTIQAITVPLYASRDLNRTVTDVNGCTISYCGILEAIVYDELMPMQIYPMSDPCNYPSLTMKYTGGIGAVPGVNTPLYDTIFGTPTSVELAYSCTLPLGAFRSTHLQDINTTYSFNPAPVSNTNGLYVFPNGTSNVAITVNQKMTPSPTNPDASGNTTQANMNKNYSFNYTIPVADNSRNNFVVLPNKDVIYVGTDQLLRFSSGRTLWPVGGYGNVRVEGWLAANAAGTTIYFKGTDANLYYIQKGGNSWYLTQAAPMPVQVKGNIICRPDGVYFIGQSTNAIHRYSGYGYQLITPTNSYGQFFPVDCMVSDPTNAWAPIIYRSINNQLYFLYQGSPGVWYKGSVTNTVCSGEVIMEGNTLYFTNAVGKIVTMQFLAFNPPFFNSETVLTAANDPTYSVKGFLVHVPSLNRFFYKGTDNRLYNFCYSSGTYVYNNWVLNVLINTVIGDITPFLSTGANAKVLYINAAKEIHVFDAAGAAWVDHPVSVLADVKSCSNLYHRPPRPCADISLPYPSTEICPGDAAAFPHVIFGSAVNASDFSLEIYESNTGSQVYSGPSNFSGSFHPTTSTIYSLVYTNAASGCAITLFWEVTIKNTPGMTVVAPLDPLCQGGTAMIRADVAEGENPEDYTLKIYKGETDLIYEGAPNVDHAVRPESTTSYSFAITSHFDGCSSISPSTEITVTHGGPDIYLTGSTEAMQLGKDGFISVGLRPEANTENYSLDIYKGADVVYSGAPNKAITVSPSSTTAYDIKVTELQSGCITRETWRLNMISQDPSFSVSTSQDGDNVFHVEAWAGDPHADQVSGFHSTWTLRELDQKDPESSFFTFSEPGCWDIHPDKANTFSGFDATRNQYDGIYTEIACDGYPGTFLADRTYKIIRAVWNDYCERAEAEAIIGSGSVDLAKKGTTGIRSMPGTLLNNWEVYPNPGEGIFTIHTKVPPTGNLEIFDVLGHKVLELSLSKYQVDYSIDLSEYLKGVYFAVIHTSTENVSRKLILK